MLLRSTGAMPSGYSGYATAVLLACKLARILLRLKAYYGPIAIRDGAHGVNVTLHMQCPARKPSLQDTGRRADRCAIL